MAVTTVDLGNVTGPQGPPGEPPEGCVTYDPETGAMASGGEAIEIIALGSEGARGVSVTASVAAGVAAQMIVKKDNVGLVIAAGRNGLIFGANQADSSIVPRGSYSALGTPDKAFSDLYVDSINGEPYAPTGGGRAEGDFEWLDEVEGVYFCDDKATQTLLVGYVSNFLDSETAFSKGQVIRSARWDGAASATLLVDRLPALWLVGSEDSGCAVLPTFVDLGLRGSGINLKFGESGRANGLFVPVVPVPYLAGA